jgi:hypothetical protein
VCVCVCCDRAYRQCVIYGIDVLPSLFPLSTLPQTPQTPDQHARTLMGICEQDRWTLSEEYQRAFVQSFVGLGMGSPFLHGSGTNLGNLMDTEPIRLAAYLAHQVTFSFFLSFFLSCLLVFSLPFRYIARFVPPPRLFPVSPVKIFALPPPPPLPPL